MSEAPKATSAVAVLANERYVSLATFRRDGRAVSTPVWCVLLDGNFYCFSAADAGKVKRMRANGRAQLTGCDIRGQTHGDSFEGIIGPVTEAPFIEQIYRSLRAKYGWQMHIADFFARISGRYQRRAVLQISV